MKQDVSLITNAERTFVEDYERQRQLGLIRIMAPAFIGISAVAIVVIAGYIWVFLPHKRVLMGVDGVLLIVIVMDMLALIVARRDQIALAAVLVPAASALGAVTIEIFWVESQGFDLFALAVFAALGAVIVEAGALGNGWVIISMTGIMNLTTAWVFLMAPRPPDMTAVLQRQIFLVAPIVIITQWIVAATMFALWRNFQSTLQQVGVAYERALQLDRLKSQFISSVNHELRTPITTLQMYIQTCLQGWDRLSREPAKIKQALVQADQVSRGLSELVLSILSTRQIDQQATNFTPAPVVVRDVVEQVIQEIDIATPDQTQQRDLQLHVPASLVIWGEQVRLKQILTNLMTNALKYSPPGSPITVVGETAYDDTATSLRRRRGEPGVKESVEVIVRDYGKGIPPEYRDLLFNQFVRLPRDLASNIVGNGLGLYLCRVYAQAMGGMIWVESTGIEGEGSTFHLRLPQAPRDAMPMAATNDVAAKANRLTSIS